MAYNRNSLFAGRRCPNHDYRSICIYHIVMQKAQGIPLFSSISGTLTDRNWPPHIDLSPIGIIIHSSLTQLKSFFPHISILRRAIMPDHIHFVIYVKEKTEIHLGKIMAKFKILCSEGYTRLGATPEATLFIPDYNDTFLQKKGQLSHMLSYVSDNPRRYLIRKQYPGWFRKFLITDGNTFYQAYGNWDLLAEPNLTPIRYSRKYSKDEYRNLRREWYDAMLNDAVIVSPFIHANEKRVRDWAMDNGVAIILIIHTPFPDKFKPGGRYFDLCSEGRLLIVSDPDSHCAPSEQFSDQLPSRATCLRLNKLAESIASRAFCLKL